MRPQIVKIVVLIVSIFVSTISWGKQLPPPPQRTPPIGLPIDGGLIYLLLLGILLGVFFLLRKKRV
ncbi:MAG: hypothetical protein CVU03_12035 [Bacteroidetes bacterium HGW-Bacteroidetes-2]|jgi:hypothetical protein|nr:MAG: hypothetical protein CVU03_12035 [Bacteroidetes bacterium HGW-Bacteroidetes-2]